MHPGEIIGFIGVIMTIGAAVLHLGKMLGKLEPLPDNLKEHIESDKEQHQEFENRISHIEGKLDQ